LQRKGIWQDVGVLKRALIDDLVAERKHFA